MVKSFKFTDHAQLSTHFIAEEFRCKCGRQHDTLISEELIDKLEQLYVALDCSKIIVTSGYRCAAHDKAVGGNGSGQHTKGTAADICCYGQDGKPISSKIVCCKAQDLGFGGIANINSTYQYTHVDVRTGLRYLGDETKGYNTVTTDFYAYFGIPREDTQTDTTFDVIRKGDSGEAVRWMQERLADRGYLRKSEIDGDFGKITLGALLAFQFEHDLDVDGLCGDKTKDALGS